MMSSVASFKLIKRKFIFRYPTKGISNQVSLNSDRNFNSYSCSNSSTKMGQNENVGKKISGLQNEAIRGLQIGSCFRDYKLRQRDYKQGQLQGFQLGQKDYKSAQEGFQNGAGIKNRCITSASFFFLFLRFLMKRSSFL